MQGAMRDGVVAGYNVLYRYSVWEAKTSCVVQYGSSGLWNFCSVAKMPMPDIAADIVPMPMVFSERTENELACKCAVLSATNTPTSI